jgi:hypothetical protein
MPILTMEQIAGYASAAGLSGEPLATATAIAMAESEGDTDAVGDTRIVSSTWGPSIGLWQIRSINAQRGTGGERDETANRNPANNAKAMMAISSGGKNWLPWSVYTTGKYRQFLAAATTGRTFSGNTVGCVCGTCGRRSRFARWWYLGSRWTVCIRRFNPSVCALQS